MLLSEIKDALFKADGAKEWQQLESESIPELGIKLTDIETVTACLSEMPMDPGPPKFVAIITSKAPFDKAKVFDLGPNAKEDSRGFYKLDSGQLVHFPDEKTLVMLHAEHAQKYLDGYAKNRDGWPLSAELTQAAAGHTLFLSFNLKQLPPQIFDDPEAKEFEPLKLAQAVSLTLDLKAKDIVLGARATFPEQASAERAKQSVQKGLTMATELVEEFLHGMQLESMSALKPVVQEAHRTLKEAKIEVAGSDLTLSASYKVSFDLGKMMAEAVPQVRESAERLRSSNNLKQIVFGLHSYHDATDFLLIHGSGPNGAPLKDETVKPLLSWRVAILPFIEQEALYKEFKLDEPWDSEHNKKLIEKMPKLFEHASKPGKPGYTHMQMIVGPNAMNPSIRTLTRIQDGTSNTFAVVEAAEPVIWTKPDDIMLPDREWPKELKKKFGGLHKGGFNAAFWDGSVRFMNDRISEADLRTFITPNNGDLPSGDR